MKFRKSLSWSDISYEIAYEISFEISNEIYKSKVSREIAYEIAYEILLITFNEWFHSEFYVIIPRKFHIKHHLTMNS